MLPGISGKVAVVTGAARPRSIGRATAVRLAREGAAVGVVDIARPIEGFPDHAVAGPNDLASLVEELEQLGARSVAVAADVTDEAQVEAAIEQIAEVLGPPQLLANVAGGSGAGFGAAPVLDVPRPEFDAVVAVNLTGTFLTSRACARRMIEHGEGGRIVNVSSQAGKIGWPLLGAYSAAKAGVIGLTQVMAKEWAAAGITVNAVCPGTVDTDLLNPGDLFVQFMDASQPGGFAGWVEREIPLGRLQQAHEVASAIAFLCSDDASYVTGEAINVSGGQMMA